MKNSTFYKLALTVVGLFFFAGLNAQILDDYENVGETIYQTEGKTFRLYVEPDLVYSPGYVAATNSPLGSTARWTWTYTGLTGAPATATPTNNNWVEFTNPALGSYSVSVAESNTIAGCADDTPVTRNIEIIAAPTAEITTGNPAQACGDQPAVAVTIEFTEAVPYGFAAYAFGVTELIENIDVNDDVIGTALVDDDEFVDYLTSGKLKFTAGASPYSTTFTTEPLTVRNGERTRYTYTLVTASDVTGTGVVSAISEKSDYIDGTGIAHPFGATTTFVAIVNPAPVTGPIYHIPNNYAY